MKFISKIAPLFLVLTVLFAVGCGEAPEELPMCEVSPIAWNALIQCPLPEEVKCNLGGKEMSGCTYKGQVCVETCTQVPK